MALGTRAGSIFLDLNLNSKGFRQQLGGLQSVAAKLGGALAGAFAVGKLVQFGKQCIDLGSDLAEVQNVVDVTFPNMTKKVNDFAQSAATKFGLSETMAKRYTGTFGSMAEAFGFTEKQAADMSTTLTGLAGDVASFYNISQDEAYTKLKSVFSGETETLKDLGIVMTQSALDAYALANGYGKTTSAMTEAEKVSLRFAFVQSQLTNAAGDFARTSDSWANQVRILTLQFDSLKASIGQGLINIFKPVLIWLNTIIARLVTAAKAFANFTGMFSKSGQQDTSWIKQTDTDLKSASTSAGSLGTSAGTASKKLGTAAKNAQKLKRFLAGFDQITKVEKQDSTSSGNNSSGNSGSGTAAGVGSAAPAIADTGKQTDETGKKAKKLNVNFDNLKKSVARLKDSFGAFVNVLKGGVKWAWEHILKPLGKWTIEKLAPKLIDILSAAFDVLTAALNALKPLAKWIWDHFLSKLAKFAGDAIIKFLELLAQGLEKVAGWIQKHPKAFDAIVTGILGLLAVKKVTGVIGSFQKKFEGFQLVWGGAGTIKEVSDELDIHIGRFGKRLLRTKDCFDGFRKKMSGAGEAFKGFGDKVKGVGTTAGNIFQKMGSGFKAFGKKAGSLGRKVGKAFLKMGKTIGGLIAANPVLFAVIAAIAAAIAIGILLYKNWDKIKKKLEPLLKAFKNFAKTIKKTFQKLPDFFKNIFKKAKEKTLEPFKKIGNWFKDRYDDICDSFSGIKDYFADKFTGALDNLKDNVPDMSELGKKISDKIGEIKKTVTATYTAIKEKTFDACKKVYDGIKNNTAVKTLKNIYHKNFKTLKKVWDTIKTDGVKKTLKVARAKGFSAVKKIWDAIKTGNFTKWLYAKKKGAFDKIKNAWDSFKTHKETLTARFKDCFTAPLKKVWNALADGVNRCTSALNKIPNVNIPQIKHLAQGGYVKKNTPQLAVIGDNRHQGEVVAPEDKLLSMARQAAAMSGGGHDAEIVNLLKQILVAISNLNLTATVDVVALKKLIVKLINDRTRATGICEINI